jgi:hypothetical protein
MPSKVRIEVDEAGLGHVYLNGTEVKDCSGVDVKVVAGQPPAVSIHVWGTVDCDLETKDWSAP